MKLKTILIYGGVAVGVYFLYKKLANLKPSLPTTPTTPTGMEDYYEKDY